MCYLIILNRENHLIIKDLNTQKLCIITIQKVTFICKEYLMFINKRMKCVLKH